ncbi:MAG TPA: hypothetical protein V6D22_14555 [Candidatus Obscuribacterales bacterium]
MLGIHALISSLCHYAVLGLILIAVASIVIFFKVFKSDFSQD